MSSSHSIHTPQNQLLSALRVAIHGEYDSKLADEAFDWSRILAEARQHNVAGLVFASFCHFPEHQRPDRNLQMQCGALTGFTKARNYKFNQVCSELISQLHADGLKASVMKGQGNAALYGPLGVYRSAGDIDVWIDGGFDRVLQYVQSVAPTRKVNELEMQFRFSTVVPVEAHHRPFILHNPIYNRRLQYFFQLESASCFQHSVRLPVSSAQNVETCVTTLRFNLVHQLVHIRHHLFTEGIGLRQLIDYYFVLDNSSEDRQSILSVLQSIGMSRFTSAIMWIMCETFGLREHKLLCAPDVNDGRFLLSEILNNGNFGIKSSNQHLSNTIAQRFGIQYFRNLKYFRFDHTEFICGPCWRIYHRLWRLYHHFK